MYWDDNELDLESCETLAQKVIPSLQSLEVLSLYSCVLTSAPIYLIANAVSKLPSFKVLKVDGNEISNRTIKIITDLLTKNGKVIGELNDNMEQDDEDDDLDDVYQDAENAEEYQEMLDEEAEEVDNLASDLEKANI